MVHVEEITDQEAAELYRLQGNDAFRAKRFEEAIHFYSEALQYQKDNPAIYTNRAAAHLKTENCLQAEADCTSALVIDPQNPKAFNRRGQARQMLGDLQGAISDFEAAMKLHSDTSIAQNLKKAREDLKEREKVTRENPQTTTKPEQELQHAVVDVLAAREEAKQLFKNGSFHDAVVKYSDILQALTKDEDAEQRGQILNNRAACYIQMKNESEALADLGQVLEFDPYNMKARLRRAIVFENIERFGAAYDDYKFLLQAHPTASSKASEAIRRLLKHFPELKDRAPVELPPRS